MKYKVDQEVAESEFERMCDLFRVDYSTDELDEKELAEWKELRGKIVHDLRTGVLIVGQDGRPTYTPAVGNSVTFNPPTGATLMALETYGGQKNISNLVAAMADMVGQERSVFGKMHARDMHSCMRLSNLFLAER